MARVPLPRTFPLTDVGGRRVEARRRFAEGEGDAGFVQPVARGACTPGSPPERRIREIRAVGRRIRATGERLPDGRPHVYAPGARLAGLLTEPRR